MDGRALMAPNLLKGEVEATIAGRRVRLLVTMDGLARLSGEIGATSLGDITLRLRGMEPRALRAAVEAFVVDEGEEVAKAMTPADIFPAHAAITAALVAAFPPNPKARRGKPAPAANPNSP